MPAAIAIVGGALANKPLNGGEAWVRLSWVLGLRRLGFRVFFVEEIAREHCSAEAVAYFDSVSHDFGLTGSASLVSDGRTLCGPTLEEVLNAAADAELLVNLSGNLTLPALLRACKRRIYVDLDPGFTQLWHAAGQLPELAAHDLHFTVGERIGKPDCAIPALDIQWRSIPPPVVLDEWPVVRSEPGRYTTVASWRGPYGPIEHAGRTLGLKAHEFRRVIDLPRRSPHTFELALDIDQDDQDDLDALSAYGWRVVDPKAVAADPSSFRSYIQGSSGEFSVAKGVYVGTGCGWFSDRTVRYLASGKPALVQDTGFSRSYPTGEGLVAFRTLDEAVERAAQIVAAYDDHCAAARRLAEEHFDSDKVLGRFLEEVGARP